MADDADGGDIRAWETQLRKGLAELCVLACLRDGETYGYALLRRLGAFPALSVSEGTLYPVLNRAAEAGWVALEHRASSSGPPRRYYRLTAAGERRLEAMTAAWRAAGRSVEQLLKHA